MTLLDNLQCGHALTDMGQPSLTSRNTLELLHDLPRLQKAHNRLAFKANDNRLDVVFRARLLAMAGVLDIYLAPELKYTWKEASFIVSKAQGHGTLHAQCVWKWLLEYLWTEELPFHRLAQAQRTVLEDEDIAKVIQLQLMEKSKQGFLKAKDLVDIVASPEIQESFVCRGICKPSISRWTAIRWLTMLGWDYRKQKKGMYIDGHERADIVKYRQEFVVRWKDREKRFHRWDNDGNELPRPRGFPVAGRHFRLIPIMHDKSIFYQNDKCKSKWIHNTSTPTLRSKGDGQSIMVSDFLTPDFGRLRDNKECVTFFNFPHHFYQPNTREARILFKPGKNRDRYFASEDLLKQVNHAINIFEGLTKGLAQGLWLFDNAPSHQKRAEDALSARRMVKSA
jgi:hypothetical protein